MTTSGTTSGTTSASLLRLRAVLLVGLLACLWPAAVDAQPRFSPADSALDTQVDLDGDIFPDRLLVTQEPGTLILSFQSEKGNREIGRLTRRAGQPLPLLRSCDVDGDGDVDIDVIDTDGLGTGHRFINDGAGHFTQLDLMSAEGSVAPRLPLPPLGVILWWASPAPIVVTPPLGAGQAVPPLPGRAFQSIGCDDSRLCAPLCVLALPSRAPPVTA